MNYDRKKHCEECGKAIGFKRMERHRRLKRCGAMNKSLRGTRHTNGAQPRSL